MKWEPAIPVYGDMIRARVGSVYHYGIFVSEDEIIAFGLPPAERFRDCPDRFRVTSTGIDVFSCGSIIEKAFPDRKEKRKRFSAEKTVSAARARLGEEGYNILHNNCEHFVWECAYGVKRCTQEEEARSRWLSRKVFDVYLRFSADACRADGKIPSDEERELLAFAADRSFRSDKAVTDFGRKAVGNCKKLGFCYSCSSSEETVAAVVSGHAAGISVIKVPGDISSLPPVPVSAPRKVRKELEGHISRGDFFGYCTDLSRFLALKISRRPIAFGTRGTDREKTVAVSFRLNGKADTVVSVSGIDSDALRIYSADSSSLVQPGYVIVD